MSNYIFNKGKKSLKYLYYKISNTRVPAMISLELIIVVSLLLYMVKKLGTLLYLWMKGFYLCNSVIFLVNNYLDSGMVVEIKNNDFSITHNEEKLIIETTKEDDLKTIYKMLHKEALKKNWKVSLANKKIEVVLEEEVK